jgi:hypothetical protein
MFTISIRTGRSPAGRSSSTARGAENPAAKRLPRSERSLPRHLQLGLAPRTPLLGKFRHAGASYAALDLSPKWPNSHSAGARVPLGSQTLGFGRESPSPSEPCLIDPFDDLAALKSSSRSDRADSRPVSKPPTGCLAWQTGQILRQLIRGTHVATKETPGSC